MIKILAIDTSTDACSAALLHGDKLIDRFVVAPQKHTSFILPMVDELLAEAELTLSQLDVVTFGSGPGSFTGARLAASIVQGFAFASSLPVVKISTLRTLAQQAFVEFDAKNVFVVTDARMGEVYWGEYQVDDKGVMCALKPDRLIKPHEIEFIQQNEFVGVGNGFEVYKDLFRDRIKVLPIKYPQASQVARLAAYDFARGLMVAPEKALPTYLREKVAS